MTSWRTSLALLLGVVVVLLAVPSGAPGARAVLGREAPGTEWFSMGSDYKRSSRFPLADAATVTDLAAYLDGNGASTGSQDVRFAVYADDAGEPGALLAQSEIGTVPAGMAATWVKLSLPSALELSAGAYHLAIVSGETDKIARYSREPAPDTLRSVSDAFDDGASSPYGSAKASDYEMAIYAVLASPSAELPPEITGLPEISGMPRVGRTLSATTGSWADTPASYAYQWRRCDARGTECGAIDGAQLSSYPIVSADEGATLRVAVTASNAAGATTAVSDPTTPVEGTVADLALGRDAPGSEWFSMGSGYKRSSRFPLADAATVTDLAAYLDGNGASTGSQDVRFAVYADDAGEPGALLAQSEIGTVPAGMAATWVKLSLPSALELSAGAYHLAIVSGETDKIARYSREPAPDTLRSVSDAFDDGASSPYGSAKASDYEMAIYALAVPTTGDDDLGAPPATATCDKVAAPDGSDAAPGSLSAPFQTAQKLADSLASGETGCLRGGTYEASDDYVLDLGRGGYRIRSYPGERARLLGIVIIRNTAAGVTLSHLAIEGTGEVGDVGGDNTIKVYAPDVVLEDNDITNKMRGRSCLILGSNKNGWTAARVVVRRNRFHECGDVANSEHRRDHGIYAQRVTDGQIVGNLFWSHAAWAIILYPNAQGTRVAHNVIDGGAPSIRGGITFSGDSSYVSNDNVVEQNVIAYSTASNIASNWDGTVGTGNVARRNCVWGADEEDVDMSGGGFSAAENLVADPLFIDRAVRDYRLSLVSPCLAVVGFDAVRALP